MKTIAIGSFFVLFAIVAGIVAAPSAFADHATASVSSPEGTSVPGCEETDECFVPSTVTIDVGGEVTWSNDDTAAHTVTSGSAADGPDGNFDSSLFMAGETFSWKADVAPGEYPYFCMVHPWMVGTVVVQAAGEEMEEHEEGEMEHMEGEESAEGMLSDGTEVELAVSPVTAGEFLTVTVRFAASEHTNHDILVTQDGEEILHNEGVHDHGGVHTHQSPTKLSSDHPVDVTITFQGYGIDVNDRTGPIGEQVMFSNIVPEFGTIATMILVVAIVSIIAVTARSKISLTPRI